MKEYQVFKGVFYVATNKSTDTEVTIKDAKSGIVLGNVPGGSQGLFIAIGNKIQVTGDIVLTIVR